MAGPFELALKSFADKTEAKADRWVRGVVLSIGARLVVRSPVDEGRFHNNWVYSLDAPDATTTEGPSAAAGVQGIGAMPVKAGGHIHWLQNNLPYGPVLEYGGYPNPPKNPTGKTINGFSTQAPLGIVRLTVLEFQGIARGVAEGLDSIGVVGIGP